MKSCLIKIQLWVGFVLFSVSVSAQDGFLEYIPLLDPAQIKVEFAITNDPASHKLFYYRAKPLELSSAAVSNLIALLSFDPTNRVQKSDPSDAFALFDHYRAQPIPAAVRFAPRQGFIEKRGQSPKLVRGQPDLVPPCEKVISMASNILLNVLGVSTNEIAQSPNRIALFGCTESTTSWLDRNTKQQIKTISARRTSASRMIDGFRSVAGYRMDGFDMTVEPGGEITNLEFRWPPVERVKSVAALPLAELQKIVAAGRARSQADGLERVVVERVDYYYDRHGQHPAPVMYYPLARLIGQGYGPGTNRLLYIFCELPKHD